MKRRILVSLSWIAAAVCAFPGTAGAATLTLSSAERFVIGYMGIHASDGSSPIPSEPYPGLPTTGAVATGTMTLDWLDASMQEADMSFSFSMFSEASPFELTGSWGASNVPVTLRITELHFESGPVRVVAGDNGVAAPASASGLIRGTLTVGATTQPFDIPADIAWGTDGQAGGGIYVGIEPDQMRLGPGLYYTSQFSELGTFPGADLLTVDGVTFQFTGAYPLFAAIYYVPEPGAAALLLLAGLALLRRR